MVKKEDLPWDVCWDFAKTGTCPRGARCTWRHVDLCKGKHETKQWTQPNRATTAARPDHDKGNFYDSKFKYTNHKYNTKAPERGAAGARRGRPSMSEAVTGGRCYVEEEMADKYKVESEDISAWRKWTPQRASWNRGSANGDGQMKGAKHGATMTVQQAPALMDSRDPPAQPLVPHPFGGQVGDANPFGAKHCLLFAADVPAKPEVAQVKEVDKTAKKKSRRPRHRSAMKETTFRDVDKRDAARMSSNGNGNEASSRTTLLVTNKSTTAAKSVGHGDQSRVFSVGSAAARGGPMTRNSSAVARGKGHDNFVKRESSAAPMRAAQPHDSKAAVLVQEGRKEKMKTVTDRRLSSVHSRTSSKPRTALHSNERFPVQAQNPYYSSYYGRGAYPPGPQPHRNYNFLPWFRGPFFGSGGTTDWYGNYLHGRKGSLGRNINYADNRRNKNEFYNYYDYYKNKNMNSSAYLYYAGLRGQHRGTAHFRAPNNVRQPRPRTQSMDPAVLDESAGAPPSAADTRPRSVAKSSAQTERAAVTRELQQWLQAHKEAARGLVLTNQTPAPEQQRKPSASPCPQTVRKTPKDCAAPVTPSTRCTKLASPGLDDTISPDLVLESPDIDDGPGDEKDRETATTPAGVSQVQGREGAEVEKTDETDCVQEEDTAEKKEMANPPGTDGNQEQLKPRDQNKNSKIMSKNATSIPKQPRGHMKLFARDFLTKRRPGHPRQAYWYEGYYARQMWNRGFPTRPAWSPSPYPIMWPSFRGDWRSGHAPRTNEDGRRFESGRPTVLGTTRQSENVASRQQMQKILEQGDDAEKVDGARITPEGYAKNKCEDGTNMKSVLAEDDRDEYERTQNLQLNDIISTKGPSATAIAADLFHMDFGAVAVATVELSTTPRAGRRNRKLEQCKTAEHKESEKTFWKSETELTSSLEDIEADLDATDEVEQVVSSTPLKPTSNKSKFVLEKFHEALNEAESKGAPVVPPKHDGTPTTFVAEQQGSFKNGDATKGANAASATEAKNCQEDAATRGRDEGLASSNHGNARSVSRRYDSNYNYNHGAAMRRGVLLGPGGRGGWYHGMPPPEYMYYSHGGAGLCGAYPPSRHPAVYTYGYYGCNPRAHDPFAARWASERRSASVMAPRRERPTMTAAKAKEVMNPESKAVNLDNHGKDGKLNAMVDSSDGKGLLLRPGDTVDGAVVPPPPPLESSADDNTVDVLAGSGASDEELGSGKPRSWAEVAASTESKKEAKRLVSAAMEEILKEGNVKKSDFDLRLTRFLYSIGDRHGTPRLISALLHVRQAATDHKPDDKSNWSEYVLKILSKDALSGDETV
ncbi:unnamed protein product [Amoebophrya sp. A25]|nr:unnamed protein product [Amoebophrya sp. A25]|eukprot:GSA25T00023602001.1